MLYSVLVSFSLRQSDYVGTFLIYIFPFVPLPTSTAGTKDQIEELLKRVNDIQGMTSSMLYFALVSF